MRFLDVGFERFDCFPFDPRDNLQDYSGHDEPLPIYRLRPRGDTAAFSATTTRSRTKTWNRQVSAAA